MTAGWSPSWAESRIMQHVLMRGHLPDAATIDAASVGSGLEGIDPRYRGRAEFFRRMLPAFSQLGSLPGELRLSVEPLHPLPDAELREALSSAFAAFGAPMPPPGHGFTVVSRSLIDAYHPAADLLGMMDLPDVGDMFLFDPLVGFLIWPEAGKARNGWLGNQRDLVELPRSPAVYDLLIHSRADHFSLGKSLLMRLVGPLLKTRRQILFDASDIPTLEVESQKELDALAEEILDACERAPAHVTAVFRGQTREHLLPDRTALAAAGVCPYADVRDHSLVPSLYRHYDTVLNDPAEFRGFMGHLLDWNLYADLVFGDSATCYTLEGQPYTPKEAPPRAHASMTMYAGGASAPNRALADLGPYTVWTITDEAGTVLDRYVRVHRPGRDSVRNNLVLQHYGAPTPFIDVTRDIRVAEWFALNMMSVDAQGLSTSGAVSPPFREPVIYVLLVMDGLTPIVNTEALVTPQEALRPHRQACAVLGGAGNLYRNAAGRFIALKIKFSDSFVPGPLPTARQLFPGPDEDDLLKRLLAHYQPPGDVRKSFPVYWFPETGGADVMA